MDKKDAATLLGVEESTDVGYVRRRYEELHSDYRIRLANAPTSTLKRLYQKNLAELREAFEALGGIQQSEQFLDLPSSEPVLTHARTVRVTDGDNASKVSSFTGRPADRSKTGRLLSYLAILLILIAASALWITRIKFGQRRSTSLQIETLAATVNGHEIPMSKVRKYFNNQAVDKPPLSEKDANSLRLTIVKQLIDDELVMEEAEKYGLVATDAEIEHKLREIKGPFTEEEFDARLKEKKVTLTDFKLDIRRSVSQEKLLKEIGRSVNISDSEVSNYYNTHMAAFNLSEPQYRIAQIFVSTAPDPHVHNLRNDKAQNERNARSKIQMIMDRLDNGDDFATLAMNYSEDSETSSRGGDLGVIPESALKNTDAATREALTKLKQGHYSPVITVVDPRTKQPVAFRILRLVSKEPPGQQPLSDQRVQQAIREELRTPKEEILRSEYYQRLHDRADIKNYFEQRVKQESDDLQ